MRTLPSAASVFEGMKESPIMQLILATIVQRLSDAEMQVQQHQRLSALGTMAAGLAHELNNPASANLRAATQLPQTLTALQMQTLKLYAAKLNGEQLAFLERLQTDLIGRAANADLDVGGDRVIQHQLGLATERIPAVGDDVRRRSKVGKVLPQHRQRPIARNFDLGHLAPPGSRRQMPRIADPDEAFPGRPGLRRDLGADSRRITASQKDRRAHGSRMIAADRSSSM